VTAYAAGCAVCGEDIEAARRRREERWANRLPASTRVPQFRLGDDGLRLAIAVLLVIAAPLFGLLLSCWFAWEAHNAGRTTLRNVMLGLAALAAVPLVTGYSLFGRFLPGL
jgi:small-conductance mechanosensitive channel